MYKSSSNIEITYNDLVLEKKNKWKNKYYL